MLIFKTTEITLWLPYEHCVSRKAYSVKGSFTKDCLSGESGGWRLDCIRLIVAKMFFC